MTTDNVQLSAAFIGRAEPRELLDHALRLLAGGETHTGCSVAVSKIGGRWRRPAHAA